jgi:NAD(P)-dependent dehydrogenase (short-subunit alcohol dehydrogenase family)
MEDLTGRVYLVTGGGTGIGRAVAEQVGRRGASVVLASRRAEHLEPAAAELSRAGIRADIRIVDVRNPDQVQQMVDSVVQSHGRLDGLVNNAAGNFVSPAERISANGWRAVVDIVLNGTWYCTSAAGRWWIENGKPGVVLNVIATYAWTGHPGTAHSSAAKAGVLAMSRTLAVEWAPRRIRVNCLAPGPTDTDGAGAALWGSQQQRDAVISSVPWQRLASPTEIADIAAFLLSDRADYVTGEVFTADGGQWLGKQVYGEPLAAPELAAPELAAPELPVLGG